MSTQPRPVLGSWKEIAAYLGKGVRTVQRWEREFGLPVRRPNGGQRRIVHASPAELDAWLATNWAQRARQAVEPGNGHHLVREQFALEVSRELRGSQRDLVAEMKRSVQKLAGNCQILALNVAESQFLRSRPVFPLRQRGADSSRPQTRRPQRPQGG